MHACCVAAYHTLSLAPDFSFNTDHGENEMFTSYVMHVHVRTCISACTYTCRHWYVLVRLYTMNAFFVIIG